MLYAEMKSSTAKSVTVEVTIPLSRSMLKTEEGISDALNEVGCLAAQSALKSFDTDGSPIVVGANKFTSKGQVKKTYQSQWGEIEVSRHVYQSSKGGRQYCPMESGSRVVLTSTPGFARLVSSKYAELGSSRVLFDLEQNHRRIISRPYLKHLCDEIGAIAQAKEESWNYEVPELPERVNSVSVGVDGTCMLLVQDGWREAMVGTISLFNKGGDRMHTIQIGATPEYGKESFYSRFEKELELVKGKFPKATYIGIADGAKDNWKYLTDKTEEQTIDFWHASGYLGKAAEAMYTGKKNDINRKEWLDEACHKLKHNIGSATRLFNEMKNYKKANRMSKESKEKLGVAITYFENNKSKMKYAKNQSNNFPIGSGVTEAACKTLIKQRLCNSGMRWKEKGAAAVLSLRALAHTDSRWDQFWGKIDQYGYSIAA